MSLGRRILLAALLILFASKATQAMNLRTIALTGGPAPGTENGTHFQSVGSPSINNSGRIVFHSSLAGDGIDNSNWNGIWLENSNGLLELIARAGDQAPGTSSGVSFASLFGTVITDEGHVIFESTIDDPNIAATFRAGTWRKSIDGAIEPIVLRGSQAPGTEEGVIFEFTEGQSINSAGGVAFWANLVGATSNQSNEGIWTGTTGGFLTLLVREGDPAIGTPVGVLFDYMFAATSLNDLGQTVFAAYASEPSSPVTFASGIWLAESDGQLNLLVRSGASVPGFGSGVQFGSFDAFSRYIDNPVLNNNGQAAFFAQKDGEGVTEDNDFGVWRAEADGELSIIVREGDAVLDADPGLKFGDSFHDSPFSDILINRSGYTAFKSRLLGDESIRSGIFRESMNGDVTTVALHGNRAPGTPEGVFFGAGFFPPDQLAINGPGQVAFRGTLTGESVNIGNDQGIWAQDLFGELQLIVREGDIVDVNEDPEIDDLRTISGLGSLAQSGNEDGRASTFNDRGQLVFLATFTDGTRGVFVSNAVAHLSGDYDLDQDIDGADFLSWQRYATLGSLQEWETNYGVSATSLQSVPESAAEITAILALLCCLTKRHVGLKD